VNLALADSYVPLLLFYKLLPFLLSFYLPLIDFWNIFWNFWDFLFENFDFFFISRGDSSLWFYDMDLFGVVELPFGEILNFYDPLFVSLSFNFSNFLFFSDNFSSQFFKLFDCYWRGMLGSFDFSDSLVELVYLLFTFFDSLPSFDSMGALQFFEFFLYQFYLF